MATEVSLAAGCRAVVTTQACEKIYRASSGTAEVRNRIDGRRRRRASTGCRRRPSCSTARASRAGSRRILRRVRSSSSSRRRSSAAPHAAKRSRSGLFADRWRIRRRTDCSSPTICVSIGRTPTPEQARRSRRRRRHGDDPLRRLTSRRDTSHRSASIIGETGGASAWNGKLVARLVARNRRGASADPHSGARDASRWREPAEVLADLTMNLTPREKDKLLIAMAAIVARQAARARRQAQPSGSDRADHRLRRGGRARRPLASPS